MPKQQQTPVPGRKEPGLIGKLLSATVQLTAWLIISLLLSIIIEWIGINRFWPEQDSNHAKTVLAMDQRYLNQSLKNESLVIKGQVISATATAVNWIAQQSWLTTLSIGTPYPRYRWVAWTLFRSGFTVCLTAIRIIGRGCAPRTPALKFQQQEIIILIQQDFGIRREQLTKFN